MGSELSNRNNMIISRERVERVVVDGGKKRMEERIPVGGCLFCRVNIGARGGLR